MSQSDSSAPQNTFNISGSSITNLTSSGAIYYNQASPKIENPNSPQTQKTILFLSANPKGTSRLRLDEEVREIDAGLQRDKRLILKPIWAVRTGDVYRALLDFKPQIVHFSGHGGGEEGLLLEDETGTAKLVDTEVLAELFKLFSERLKLECVILNACYSEVQAEAIVCHIPYVIGMNRAISDQAAIRFSVGFYDALSADESVEFAYELGKLAIGMAGIKENLIPVLKKKSS